MSLTINTKTYSQDRVEPDRVVYAGPANNLSVVDKIALARVLPKSTANFRGVLRPSAKITRTVVINAETGETAPAIMELTGSLPVGMTDADVGALVSDVAALAATPAVEGLSKEGSIFA